MIDFTPPDAPESRTPGQQQDLLDLYASWLAQGERIASQIIPDDTTIMDAHLVELTDVMALGVSDLSHIAVTLLRLSLWTARVIANSSGVHVMLDGPNGVHIDIGPDNCATCKHTDERTPGDDRVH